MLPTKALCLFASYQHESENFIRDETLHYVKALAPAFDEIHFVTNTRLLSNRDLFPENVSVFFTMNGTMDFGMWTRHIKDDSVDLGAYARVALVNDSCVSMVDDLSGLMSRFGGVDAAHNRFWGITDSQFFSYHIQSYFLVLDGSGAISAFLRFMDNHALERIKTKFDVVAILEVNLTCYMMASGIATAALYPWRVVNPIQPLTTSYHCYEQLMRLGCPIIKRVVIDHIKQRRPMYRGAQIDPDGSLGFGEDKRFIVI